MSALTAAKALGILSKPSKVAAVIMLATICFFASTSVLAQLPNGNAAGFEIDNCGTLFSGNGGATTANDSNCLSSIPCQTITAGDDWAQGTANVGILDNDGLPAIDPNTGLPFRVTYSRDQNWGNKGDKMDATQFGGTSNKNNDNISICDPLEPSCTSPGALSDPWVWNGTGGGPQKNDVTAGYAHTRVDPISGDRWIMIAGETRSTNGDSHVDMEFNLAGVQICDSAYGNCAQPGSMPLAGITEGVIIGLGPHAGRTADSDFIVSVDFVTGGKSPMWAVRFWTENPPGSGQYEYLTTTQLGIDVTGKVFVATNACNELHDTLGGDWTHFTGDGAPTSTMTRLQFVEIAINATAFGLEIDPCSPNSTINVKTRSSQSFTAELKDFDLFPFFLEPTPECEIDGPTTVCPGEEGITYTATEINGLPDVTFSWEIVGDATFCDGTTEATGDTVCVNASLDCGGGFTLVTTVQDGACSTTCFYTVNLEDEVDPTISCPDQVEVQCIEDVPDPDITQVQASDNCGTPTVTWEGDVSDGQTCPETITRTYRATDDCGNTADCTQLIIINDTEAPAITCPDPVTVECRDDVPAPDITEVTASDNCSTPTVEWVGDVSDGQTCPETITRTYRATDDCDNSTTCTQTITVNDTTDPVLEGCPEDTTVQCLDDVPDPADVTATDNCDGELTPDFDEDSVSADCVTTITRTWTATDACGNSDSCTQIIVVIDTEDPTISCPGPVTVECLDDVPAPDISLVTASDNCDADPLVEWVGDESDGQTCPETITRTYRATDDCGNSKTCTQTITVNDTTDPVLEGCPDDLTVQCLDDVPEPADVTATDNCDGELTPVFDESSVSEDCITTITRTWTATDACGNSDSCTQIIVVWDTIAPSILCPNPVTVQCSDDVPEPDTSLVVAWDNCSTPVVTWEGDESDGQTCPETITRTYRATDDCGNTTDCTQLITVNDTIDPVLEGCPQDVTVECIEDVPEPADVTATDNCDGELTPVFDESSVSADCVTTITRTWTATDACGNSDSCTQIIVVQDTTPPTIQCPDPISVECGLPTTGDIRLAGLRRSGGSGVVAKIDTVPPPDISLVTASDNCSTPVITWVGDESDGQTCPETITRTYRATDDCGNFTDCTQTITINDTTDPVLEGCPDDLTVQCLSDVPEPTDVTATDNCDGELTPDFDEESVSEDCITTITRTWTATDACGNSDSCTQIIVVWDTIAPSILCPNPVSVQCSDDVPEPDTSLVVAWDNCSTPVVTWEGDESDGQTCPETITRTYRATDDCGNTTDCTQLITVDDTQDPTITCPNPVTVECLDDVPEPDTSLVTASDNCDADPLVEWVGDVSDGQTCPETITRTYRATDDCGNSKTCTQLITVDDTTSPTISCLSDMTVACNVPVEITVTAEDNCDSTPTITVIVTDPSDPDRFIVEELGNGHFLLTLTGSTTATVTLVAVDDCGNESEPCVFTVSATCNQACSPGYWRNHPDSWCATPYNPVENYCVLGPATLFVDAFMLTDFSSTEIPDWFDPFDPMFTLLDAVSSSGQPFNQALFHGSAALLSASHPDVNFPVDPADVIAVMQDAFAGNITFQQAFIIFATWNAAELDGGCPID